MSSNIPSKRAPADVLDVQKIVDEASSDGKNFVDESNLLKHIDWLQRAVLLNIDHRTKYAGNPEKFMHSEVQLDEELGRFESVATQPELLSLLSQSKTWFETFFPLLQHQNTDIASRVISLLADMTEMDEDITPEGYDSLFEFCEGLLANGLLTFLLENLERIDEEKDGSDIIFKTFLILENLLDIDSSLLQATPLATWTSWSVFLCNRFFSQTGPEQNRFYAAELTAILLRSLTLFKEAFFSTIQGVQGVDMTLAALGGFLSSGDPHTADETEYFENLFDILCDAVLEPAGLEHFLACQGIQLLLIMLKETKMVRIRALRVLSFALTDRETVAKIAEIIVAELGLKVLSPILARKGTQALKKAYPKNYSDVQDVEYIASIFASLLRFTSDQTLTRVETKFSENDGEKVDILIQLHSHYASANPEEYQLAQQQLDILLAILKSRRLVGLGQAKSFAAIKSEIATTLKSWAESLEEVAPEEQTYLLDLCLKF